MIAKKTIAAGLIALSSLTAVPANASGLSVEFGFGGPTWGDHGGGSGGGHHWRRHNRLSTQEVRWILRDDGYRNIRFFDERGPVYQVRARKHGRSYFLVVSARSGQILSRNRI